MPLTNPSACSLAILASLCASASAQDAGGEAGRLVYNNACRTCHTLREGDLRLGPNLNGVIGREAGSVAGFAYSSAMKNAGFAWDEGKLDQFIANPDAVVPGHAMRPYAPLTDAEERASVVEFLRATQR